jgi:hypothetical protein
VIGNRHLLADGDGGEVEVLGEAIGGLAELDGFAVQIDEGDDAGGRRAGRSDGGSGKGEDGKGSG